MTEEQIKAIAEEYADSFGNDKSYRNDPCYGGHVVEAEDVIEWLCEKYCIAEREKVKALHDNIFSAIMYAHDEDDWQDAGHYILDVMPRRFAAVFGSEIGKEEEE
ncbi:MAG: hypothetical protein NC548_36900 [Lachnospiraceae bacterium]|nr:hypothetical protein [Lachnospiraceae bacterium]